MGSDAEGYFDECAAACSSLSLDERTWSMVSTEEMTRSRRWNPDLAYMCGL